MNLLYVSFAAFGPSGDHEYIRARRYPVSVRGNFQQFDIETRIEPDYDPSGLFETGIPHRFTVIKRGFDLFMKIEPGDLPALLCYWHTDKFPMIGHGRIGIRHICTRAARYRDFRVYCMLHD